MNEYLSYRLGLKNGTQVKPEKPKPKPIAPRSKKMEKQMIEYRKIVDEMLKESDRCELSTPVCVRKATGLQHMKRRGKNLLDKKLLKRACNPCNLWCEENPLEALKMGLSLSVHKKESVEV